MYLIHENESRQFLCWLSVAAGILSYLFFNFYFTSWFLLLRSDTFIILIIPTVSQYEYSRYKGKENCIHLIAEELDSDGKISNREVSRKLKQLGFKFPQKKRVLKNGASNQVREDAKASGSEVTHPDLQENSSGRRVLYVSLSVPIEVELHHVISMFFNLLVMASSKVIQHLQKTKQKQLNILLSDHMCFWKDFQ